MTAPIMKRLCLAAMLFGMIATTASAQMSSVLMDNDLICADPTTIYPEAVLSDAQAVDQQIVSRTIDSASSEVSVLADKYDALGASNNISVVDWVQIELRAIPQGGAISEAARPAGGRSGVDSIAVARTPGLLLTDGRVVDPMQEEADVVSGITIDQPENLDMDAQDIYLVVAHRNHLDIMSASPINNDIEEDIEINFALHSTRTYLPATSLKENNDGTFSMITGDVDGDGQVQGAADSDPIVIPNSGISRYHNGDVNLDQQVQAAVDTDVVIVPNAGRGSQIEIGLTLDNRLTFVGQVTEINQIPCWSGS